MKKQIIIGLSLLTSVMLRAQESSQYLHFNAGGGLNNLSYQLQDGTRKGRLGYTVNAAYSYFFTPSWGVQSGVGLQSFRALSTLNLLTTENKTDSHGDDYELRTLYKDWKEKQQTLFLDIPLSVQFRHALNDKLGLQASAGAQVSIPMQTSYKTAGGGVTTTGFYDQWNIELSDLPQHGFSTTTKSYEGNYSLKTAYMGIADVGGLYKLSEKTHLYVGAYLNYGLNNVLKPDSRLVYEQDGSYHGILASNQTSQVTPVSFGLKVGIYWRIGKKSRKFRDNLPVEALPASQPVDTVQIKPEEKPDTVLEVPAAKPNVDSIRIKETFEKAEQIASTFHFKFAFNSDQTRIPDTTQVKALSDILLANPTFKLSLVGHTCNLGARAVNIRIGLKRALFVKESFLKNGVPDTQVNASSKAFDEPLVPNTSAKNREKNRRVEAFLTR